MKGLAHLRRSGFGERNPSGRFSQGSRRLARDQMF
jgi:hypothetical protein